MDINVSINLLKGIKLRVDELKYGDYTELDGIRKKLDMYIVKIFGELSTYRDTLKKISFNPTISFISSDESIYVSSWNRGSGKILNLINTMMEDLELTEFDTPKVLAANQKEVTQSINIFIVHGHNEQMKETVARVISKLELSPIILHEQPNKGRTIIEKFTDHADVNFAVVLLSADDFGYSVKENPEQKKLRARQNVIMELGFFLGKLNRERVVVLVEDVENFEFPSDYHGVLYIPFDSKGNWKFALVKELKECGYNVDANKLL